jgi:hypothetical protein
LTWIAGSRRFAEGAMTSGLHLRRAIGLLALLLAATFALIAVSGGEAASDQGRQNRLAHNAATGAGDDGFDIESSSTKLTGNRAQGNADLGIEAVRGVRNGGR